MHDSFTWCVHSSCQIISLYHVPPSSMPWKIILSCYSTKRDPPFDRGKRDGEKRPHYISIRKISLDRAVLQVAWPIQKLSFWHVNLPLFGSPVTKNKKQWCNFSFCFFIKHTSTAMVWQGRTKYLWTPKKRSTGTKNPRGTSHRTTTISTTTCHYGSVMHVRAVQDARMTAHNRLHGITLFGCSMTELS